MKLGASMILASAATLATSPSNNISSSTQLVNSSTALLNITSALNPSPVPSQDSLSKSMVTHFFETTSGNTTSSNASVLLAPTSTNGSIAPTLQHSIVPDSDDSRDPVLRRDSGMLFPIDIANPDPSKPRGFYCKTSMVGFNTKFKMAGNNWPLRLIGANGEKFQDFLSACTKIKKYYWEFYWTPGADDGWEWRAEGIVGNLAKHCVEWQLYLAGAPNDGQCKGPG